PPIYTLSLHDALPILKRAAANSGSFKDTQIPSTRKSEGNSRENLVGSCASPKLPTPSTLNFLRISPWRGCAAAPDGLANRSFPRSEEHTSELQSQSNI